MSNARIYLDQTRELVLKIFDNKCIMCGRPTKEVHEIITISHGKKHLAVKNRVPLCGNGSKDNHHDWAHRIGTRNSIPVLLEKRAEFLKRKWSMRTRHPKLKIYDEVVDQEKLKDLSLRQLILELRKTLEFGHADEISKPQPIYILASNYQIARAIFDRYFWNPEKSIGISLLRYVDYQEKLYGLRNQYIVVSGTVQTRTKTFLQLAITPL